MNDHIVIGLDATWLQNGEKSGVGFYTEYLADALADAYPNDLIVGHYYRKMFSPRLRSGRKNLIFRSSPAILLKVSNLLRRWGIEIPFEAFLRRRVDFMIFPAYISRPSLFNTPSATVIHDLAYIDIPESVSRRNQHDLARFVPISISRANFIITVSNWSKWRIMEYYKVSRPVIITPLPPVKSTFPVDVDLDKRFGIKGRYILIFGTLEPRKNITKTIEGYLAMPFSTRQRYALVLAGGKGWNDSAIGDQIAAAQSEATIIVTGYVNNEERDALYTNADLFAMCSLYEGFGMPLLEAMAHHTPVMASDIAVFHEVCGNAAAYCDPNDSVQIGTVMANLLLDQHQRQRLVTAGHENLARFTWTKNAQLIHDQILQTLGRASISKLG